MNTKRLTKNYECRMMTSSPPSHKYKSPEATPTRPKSGYSLAIVEATVPGVVDGPAQSKSCLEAVKEVVVHEVEGLTHSPWNTSAPHAHRLLPPAAIPRVQEHWQPPSLATLRRKMDC